MMGCVGVADTVRKRWHSKKYIVPLKVMYKQEYLILGIADS